MEKKLTCEVVTPDRVVFSGEVDMVVAPGVQGELGVLPLHAPFLTQLAVGELRVRFEKEGRAVEDYFAVHGGFMEVFEDRVTVLAPAAELAREIDLERAKKARERAAERLKAAEKDGADLLRAEAAAHRARQRIKTAERRIGHG